MAAGHRIPSQRSVIWPMSSFGFAFFLAGLDFGVTVFGAVVFIADLATFLTFAFVDGSYTCKCSVHRITDIAHFITDVDDNHGLLIIM